MMREGGVVPLFFKKEIEKKICPCLFSQFTLLYTQSVAGGAVGVPSLTLLCGDINMNAGVEAKITFEVN